MAFEGIPMCGDSADMKDYYTCVFKLTGTQLPFYYTLKAKVQKD